MSTILRVKDGRAKTVDGLSVGVGSQFLHSSSCANSYLTFKLLKTPDVAKRLAGAKHGYENLKNVRLFAVNSPETKPNLNVMNEIYEYKRRPNRKVTWFAACCIGFLFGFGLLTSNPKILGLVWGLIAVCLLWILMKSPTAGIKLDDQSLTLAAWRNPREVPLSAIDHLEVQHWTDETDVRIVYRDGGQEVIPFGDLPDMDTFSRELVYRGVELAAPSQGFKR